MLNRQSDEMLSKVAATILLHATRQNYLGKLSQYRQTYGSTSTPNFQE